MLATPPGRRLSRTRLGLLADLPPAELATAFEALEQEGRASLLADGADPAAITATRSADLRYRGQSYTLEVPVELVNLRVAVQSTAPAVTLGAAPPAGRAAEPTARAPVSGVAGLVPVYERGALAAGQRLTGPAILTEASATTWIAPGWTARVDAVGNLLLGSAGGKHGAAGV
jgi:N-methylhydantoinase A